MYLNEVKQLTERLTTDLFVTCRITAQCKKGLGWKSLFLCGYK